MKFSAAIFISLITFLTVQPSFSKNPMGNFPAKKSCSAFCDMKKKCSKEDSKKTQDCSANGCNPFMPCPVGNFFIDEEPYQLSNDFSQLSNKMIVANDKIVSTYVADCWHPPEY